MSKLIEFNKYDNGFYKIALNRPELHNAFNDKLIEQLTDLFISFKDDEEIRLVLLTSHGKSFCAGADLNWMKSMVDYTEKENIEDSEKLFNMFDVINSCKVPVICEIRGAALGGGVGLVAVSDYCIASKNAKFGLTEVRLGLVPAVISPFVINKIGESYSRAYFLSGERFSSSRALEIGLIHEECEPSDLDDRIQKVVSSFLKTAPNATRTCKELINEVVHGENKGRPEKKKGYTCQTIAKLRVSVEGQEGMNALLEKRSPKWMV